MVLVTACADANPREGVDFLPLTCRLQGKRLRLGAHSRRVLQARRQAAREGSAHQPPDRSPDPAAVPGRLAQRDADHRAGDLGRHRERLRRAGDHRRVGGARAVEHPADADDCRRARRPRRRRLRDQPDLRAAQAQHARPDRRRHQGRHRDGRGRREGSAAKSRWCRRSSARTRRSRRSSPASTRSRRRPASRSEPPSPKKEIGTTFVARSRGARCSGRSPTRCGSRTSSRTTRTVDKVSTTSSPAIPEDDPERKAEAKSIVKELKEKILRDEILERGQRLDGRKFDEIRNDHDRSRRPAAHARLGRVHARRDPGARHRDARHGRRPAEGRDGRRRDVEALHAPLQLPAVLGRRSASSCADPAGARSATARSPSARSCR